MFFIICFHFKVMAGFGAGGGGQVASRYFNCVRGILIASEVFQLRQRYALL